ncbi:hypothetical protein F5050DRAFT_1576334 [Lentinula boryana]|uniref:Uncharacterized protein n=1 Tax=Lentinula boryana TaxID=40481 RepID=A0ABQ8Q6G7_9AGAR|nr:hypothetical protein F5050DRAFT_1576334 [Lentinula boryana]
MHSQITEPKGKPFAPVIIDIASPPTGSLNLFNIYVALSHRHSAELLAEDDQLEKNREGDTQVVGRNEERT